jgi:predicted ATPase
VDHLAGKRPVRLLRRGPGVLDVREADGRKAVYRLALLDTESVLGQLREPHRFPQLSALRQEFLGWRFYHHFRTDAESPLRVPQVGVFTPNLATDGSDLGAALQTIIEAGDSGLLDAEVNRAFPGATLRVFGSQGVFSIGLHLPDFLDPFGARELSDGTLRYLCLLAALLSPRPPAVIGLNEPEMSLHPDLLEPLARLIVTASRHSQMWITTHSQALASYIEMHSGEPPVQLHMVEGETRVVGQEGLSRYLGYEISESPDEEED